MTKNQYDAIADAFKHTVTIQQWHYAQNGFDKETATHTKEGRDLYVFFRSQESLCFRTANALADGNKNFDRDTFLKKAGMMSGKGSYSGWSFVPNKEFIDHFSNR